MPIHNPTSTIPHPFPPHQFITDPAELITYEVDAGFDRAAPDGVFFPESTADVSRVLAWAATHDIPLIARGAGTGLAGGAIAKQGGVILVFSRMNRIVKLDRSGRSVTVEAGAVNLDVDAAAKTAGLYYPPDPSSGRSAHIGGNLGTNAGGPHCFKYGVTTNYVTGLETVLAGGEVVQLGGQALDYPEYDLCGLVVGSEGTLAVITRADLRLIRTPPGVMTMMVAFESAEQAGQGGFGRHCGRTGAGHLGAHGPARHAHHRGVYQRGAARRCGRGAYCRGGRLSRQPPYAGRGGSRSAGGQRRL